MKSESWLPLRQEPADVAITILGDTNTHALTNVDAAKQAMLSAASQPLMKRAFERAPKGELRWTAALFPTEAYAQDADMSLTECEDSAFRACLLDQENSIAPCQASIGLPCSG